MNKKATKLTDKQRDYAIQMLHQAFICLRSGELTRDLLNEGKGKKKRMRKTHAKVVAFGEALHNIPLDIIQNRIDFIFHKDKISSYMDVCPELQRFLGEIDSIQNEVPRIPN